MLSDIAFLHVAKEENCKELLKMLKMKPVMSITAGKSY